MFRHPIPTMDCGGYFRAGTVGIWRPGDFFGDQSLIGHVRFDTPSAGVGLQSITRTQNQNRMKYQPIQNKGSASPILHSPQHSSWDLHTNGARPANGKGAVQGGVVSGLPAQPLRPFRHLPSSTDQPIAKGIIVKGFSLNLPLIVFVLLASVSTLFADDPNAKGPRPRQISFGEEVNLADQLVPGIITVFDFYSDFCPPCRALEPHLETLHMKRPDIAVVIVNINRHGVRGIDWGSPVAQEFQLRSIPHLVIYDQGCEVAAEVEAARAKLVEWLKEL